ncbi:hypothetical protein C8J56DRAFT_1072592 [Mycena floridula]|nr:hypothetical protein C8J56DRAFT_1072592 [Mycena floridula]
MGDYPILFTRNESIMNRDKSAERINSLRTEYWVPPSKNTGQCRKTHHTESALCHSSEACSWEIGDRVGTVCRSDSLHHAGITDVLFENLPEGQDFRGQSGDEDFSVVSGRASALVPALALPCPAPECPALVVRQARAEIIGSRAAISRCPMPQALIAQSI